MTSSATPMSQPGDPFTAEILEAGARGYAALATSRLLEHGPLGESTGGVDPDGFWRSHLTQRVLELQTALAVGRPEVFVERVRWSRRAYRARSVGEEQLRAALESLRDVLAAELPAKGRDEALSILSLAIDDFAREVEVEGRELDPTDDLDRRCLLYLLDVLEGRPRDAIEGVLGAVRDEGIGLQDAVLRILLPAQREIGRLWHLGDSDIAEEHLATATTKRALSALAHVARPAPVDEPTTLVTAAVAGDTHDVGGLALTVLMEAEGWRCIDLGADVPVEDLVSARVAFDPDVIVLSGTLSAHLASLERAVRILREDAGDALRIAVGGSAFAEVGGLAEEWGADALVSGVGDARERLTSWA